MEPSEFDRMLRGALLDAARADWDQALEEAQAEPDFSGRYRRERNRLLRDPFGHAKRKTRPMWQKVLQTAASIVLAAGIGLGGVLAVSPEARAWVVWRMSAAQGEDFAVFTKPEHLDGGLDASRFQPTYIPDGFEVVWEDRAPGAWLELDYEDGAGNYIDYEAVSLSSSVDFSFHLDNEHSDSFEIQINGLPATLMVANTEGYSSYLVWMDGEAGVAYCITATLDREEIIRIAESVTYSKENRHRPVRLNGTVLVLWGPKNKNKKI